MGKYFFRFLIFHFASEQSKQQSGQECSIYINVLRIGSLNRSVHTRTVIGGEESGVEEKRASSDGYLYSPTTCRLVCAMAVENVGASRDTSHEKLPAKPKPTFLIKTWSSSELCFWNERISLTVMWTKTFFRVNTPTSTRIPGNGKTFCRESASFGVYR